jgi:hypothetical protein
MQPVPHARGRQTIGPAPLMATISLSVGRGSHYSLMGGSQQVPHPWGVPAGMVPSLNGV